MTEQFNILIVSNTPSVQEDPTSLKQDNIKMNIQKNGVDAFNYLNSLNEVNFPKAIVIDTYLEWMDASEFMNKYVLDFHYKYPQTLVYVMRTGLAPANQNRFEQIPAFAEIIQKPISAASVYTKTMVHNKLEVAA